MQEHRNKMIEEILPKKHVYVPFVIMKKLDFVYNKNVLAV